MISKRHQRELITILRHVELAIEAKNYKEAERLNQTFKAVLDISRDEILCQTTIGYGSMVRAIGKAPKHLVTDLRIKNRQVEIKLEGVKVWYCIDDFELA